MRFISFVNMHFHIVTLIALWFVQCSAFLPLVPESLASAGGVSYALIFQDQTHSFEKDGDSMSSDNGKVHRLETVKGGNGQAGEEQGEAPVQGVADAQKDMSKVAMIVSLLAVILLVIFFFGMNRNIAGITDEVKSLGALREDVSNLDQRMLQMKSEMPAHMKRMLAHDMVNEMSMKAFYLTDTLDDPALRGKMQEVLQGLKEVRDGLEK